MQTVEGVVSPVVEPQVSQPTVSVQVDLAAAQRLRPAARRRPPRGQHAGLRPHRRQPVRAAGDLRRRRVGRPADPGERRVAEGAARAHALRSAGAPGRRGDGRPSRRPRRSSRTTASQPQPRRHRRGPRPRRGRRGRRRDRAAAADDLPVRVPRRGARGRGGAGGRRLAASLLAVDRRGGAGVPAAAGRHQQLAGRPGALRRPRRSRRAARCWPLLVERAWLGRRAGRDLLAVVALAVRQSLVLRPAGPGPARATAATPADALRGRGAGAGARGARRRARHRRGCSSRPRSWAAAPGLELLQPFAVALLGGLVTSTVVVLFLVPALVAAAGGLRPAPVVGPDTPDGDAGPRAVPAPTGAQVAARRRRTEREGRYSDEDGSSLRDRLAVRGRRWLAWPAARPRRRARRRRRPSPPRHRWRPTRPAGRRA